MTTRYAIHPEDFKHYDTVKIRKEFHVPDIFIDGEVTLCYTHYDRFILGGAKPVGEALELPNPVILRANFFLERRELGIINVGDTGTITVDGKSYELAKKEALYVGRGSKQVLFQSTPGKQALFYFNSAPAHAAYPTQKITFADCESTELGAAETANRRVVRKLIINSVKQTCQLQMGLTEIATGSVWNTMPPHVHDRRMEAYFYFDVADTQRVCHFLGEPNETRHIWVENHQAVLSPPWSIHAGAGTSNYSFIWGMAGENLDYADMDPVPVGTLR